MEKMYGYKEEDVISLARFITERKGVNLTKIFEQFSLKTGKAQGTIRNMYYALVKFSAKNHEFTKKYLDGVTLSASKIVEFSKKEESELVEKILVLKQQGKSVRQAIGILSNGDEKLALRYQNKYRNILKKSPELIEKTSKKIGLETKTENKTPIISDAQYLKLKQEIDGLVGRISTKIRKENELLKARIEVLELENLRLNNLLYASENAKSALSFLKTGKNQNALN